MSGSARGRPTARDSRTITWSHPGSSSHGTPVAASGPVPVRTSSPLIRSPLGCSGFAAGRTAETARAAPASPAPPSDAARMAALLVRCMPAPYPRSGHPERADSAAATMEP